MKQDRGDVPVVRLHVGGLVAAGFDGSGRYLLTISHSGRGVFDTTDWRRVARDEVIEYPEAGTARSIGPINGECLSVTEVDYAGGRLTLVSPDGRHVLTYEDGVIEIRSAASKSP